MRKQAMPSGLGKYVGRLGSAARHAGPLASGAAARAGRNTVDAAKWIGRGFPKNMPLPGERAPIMGGEISHLVNAPRTNPGAASFGRAGMPAGQAADTTLLNVPSQIPRTPRETPVPMFNAKYHSIRPALQLNPNIMKQANSMQPITLLGLALTLQDTMAKQARAERLDRQLTALDVLVMTKQAGPLATLRGLAGKAMPAINKGFGHIGEQVAKLPQEGFMGRALGGEGGIGKVLASQGDHPVADPAALRQLGQTVTKRVGIGAGAGTGAVLAAEAPGKMQNNEAFEHQQQHPIQAWMAQHLLGRPKLQHKSYLNPFSA